MGLYGMNYTIKNDDLKVQACSRGAELRSIESYQYEYLWQGNPEYWPGRAPILFPIVGGLKNKEYLHKGKKYSMPNHGIARINEFQVIQVSDQELLFSFESTPETLLAYPFSFKMDVSYRLEKRKLLISHCITNLSQENMPFTFGLHPAFNLADRLERSYIELDDEPLISQIDTENGFIVEKTKDYGRQFLCFDTNSFDNNNTIIFDNLRSRQVVLHFQNSPRKVKMEWNDDLPLLAFWSKAGSSFICIEPWNGWADSLEDTINELSQKKGMSLLAPHESQNIDYSIELF
ncbi:MAG: aldose 1-epimerase family protein [Brevinema sp.]